MKKYVPAIDGIRWWSFVLVFFFHASEGRFPFGYWGVAVFFTISGFLIGGILLDIKNNSDISLMNKLKIFLIRRSLRIFPLYYIVLTAMFFCQCLDLLKVMIIYHLCLIIVILRIIICFLLIITYIHSLIFGLLVLKNIFIWFRLC